MIQSVSREKCVCHLLWLSPIWTAWGDEEEITEKTEEVIVTQYDLTKLLADAPKNCWLALNEEQTKIVGRGETMKEAIKDANDNGVKDPIVMWAPKQWTLSVFEVNR